MTKILKWLENIWNLRLIFDKYLPKTKELLETVKTLQKQIEELKAIQEELQNENVKKIEQAPTAQYFDAETGTYHFESKN